MSFIEKFVRGVGLQRTDFAAAVDDSEIRIASTPLITPRWLELHIRADNAQGFSCRQHIITIAILVIDAGTCPILIPDEP